MKCSSLVTASGEVAYSVSDRRLSRNQIGQDGQVQSVEV